MPLYTKRSTLLICVVLDLDRAELLRALRHCKDRGRRKRIYLGLLSLAGRY
jgi:hypothetical protein